MNNIVDNGKLINNTLLQVNLCFFSPLCKPSGSWHYQSDTGWGTASVLPQSRLQQQDEQFTDILVQKWKWRNPANHDGGKWAGPLPWRCLILPAFKSEWHRPLHHTKVIIHSLTYYTHRHNTSIHMSKAIWGSS